MGLRCSRRAFLTAAGLASLTGCLGGPRGSVGGGDTPTEAETAVPGTESGGAPPTADASLPLPMAGEELRERSQSGGPTKDGIPSVDEPSFVDPSTATEFLDPGDVVFGVARGNEAKAYPQSILVWHEVANDVIDGDPVSVTYCPLTGTAQGFDRGATTFGVSGRLLNNNLVMYDRATERWWPQVLATSIPGPWSTQPTGQSLREFRVIWTTWERWREQHPETSVLSTDTGYARNYGQDPYGSYNPKGGYYESSGTLFSRLNEDDRFEAKLVVMGVRTPDGAAATPKSILRQRGIVDGAIDGTPLLWAYDPDLDTGYAYWNPEDTDFSYRQGRVDGPGGVHDPDRLPLDRVPTFDAMWFAWSGFYPETNVHE
jgi:hypothetical protein